MDRGRRVVLLFALVLALGACSSGDGRDLAEPDPDITRVTTTAPTAIGEQARGAAAAELAIPVSSQGPNGLTISSSDFVPGAVLPSAFTCDGESIAPSVKWTGNTTDGPLALVVRDADAGGAVHWLVTDLTGPVGTIDASTSTELANGFGETGWTAPCPGDGLEHRYVFTIYAFDDPPDLASADDALEIVERIEAEHVSAATTLAKYARP